MRILKLQQGTPEWHAARAKHFTASEAPVMMAASSKMKRNELLEMKALGTEKEISDYVQKFLFDKGHEMEALARPIVEEIIGEELYPTVAVSECGEYLASFDGLTMMGDIVFEHKMWNESLAQSVRDEKLDPEYYWQLEHQLMVSKAEKAIFVVSDGTKDNMVHMWYTPVRGRRGKLVKGWQQFRDDLSTFEPPAKAEPVVGESPEDLPALLIKVEGQVKETNLATFKQTAMHFIENINTELQTDKDFADAEVMVKFCKRAEDELEQAKKHALAQTQSIDELFKTIDHLKDQLRDKRLTLDKLVKSRKDEIRAQLRVDATDALKAHVERVNKETLGDAYITLDSVLPDFGAAMKGKKTVDSLKSAVDDALAEAKIDVTERAEVITENLLTYAELVGEEHRILFNDVKQLVLKRADDFRATVKERITDYKAQQLEIKQRQQEQEAEAKAKVDAEVKRPAEPEPEPEAPEVEPEAIKAPAEPVKAFEGVKPPKELVIQAVVNAFNCDRAMASIIICETADSIRGLKNGGGRIGKTALAMGDRIFEAQSKEDLLAVGKEIQHAKHAGDIDEIDDAVLQAQYRRKQFEFRA
jgi:predicted phage-related endonuclease